MTFNKEIIPQSPHPAKPQLKQPQNCFQRKSWTCKRGLCKRTPWPKPT